MARPISLQPAKNSVLRHATRLLSMIHELHKAGYQRVRFSAGMSPSGMHWRCTITHADNMTVDSLSVRNHELAEEVAHYSTSSGNQYFGWTDTIHCSARELAVKFIKRYPVIARKGDGRDWRYAGWLTDTLGRAEQEIAGSLPIFFADYDLDLDPEWLPPRCEN